MATIFMMLGGPGSGKTYFATELADSENAVHLNSDRLRREIFVLPTYREEEHRAVFRTMNLMAEECLRRGTSVVFDANNNKRTFRRRMMDRAEGLGANYLMVRVNVPMDTAVARVGSRVEDLSHPLVSLEVMRQIHLGAEGPFEGEPYVEIDGMTDPQDQIDLMGDKIQTGVEEREGDGNPGRELLSG